MTLYTSDRLKNDDGTWGWSDAIDNPDLTCHVQGKTVEVHGFNYDECYVSETPRTKGTNTAYYGTALIIKINVAPDYTMIDDNAALITDGNIPTNAGTANLLNSAGRKVATVNTPHIAAHTVTYQYTDPVTRQTVVYRNYYRLPGVALSRITQTPSIHGYTFDGWTTSDVTVAADGTFTMPEMNVVLYGTTSTKPIPDGALQIRKEVSAPDGFDGKDTFTFHIYQVIGDTKTLVETVTVKVSSKTGRGESALIELPKGSAFLVEEAGAGVPGYALTTTVTDRNGDPLPSGAMVVVGPRVIPTVLNFTNTYEELSLETRDHFGYIIGYPDETVRPEAHITRAEVATIFFRLLTDEKRAECWSQTNSFIDVAPNAWYNNAISTLVKAGALAGYGDNTFQPDRYVTRAEAMKIINRTLNRAPHKDHLLPDMITWADNADTSAWYYAEVQEATNSHMYYRDNTHEVWEKIRPIRDWAELEKQWSNAYSGKQ